VGVPNDSRRAFPPPMNAEGSSAVNYQLRLILLVPAILCSLCLRPLQAFAGQAVPPWVELTRKTRQTGSTGPLGVRAVQYARHLIGVRYRYGGSSPRTGFDCSGFVRFVYSHVGVDLPHSSYAQFNRGRRVSRGSLRPVDLVFFDGVGHVGLYIGGGRFIHAPHSGTRVSISSLAGWYAARYDGARRLVPAT
jgi:cell wall-associated NlpC family hydrolase